MFLARERRTYLAGVAESGGCQRAMAPRC